MSRRVTTGGPASADELGIAGSNRGAICGRFDADADPDAQVLAEVLERLSADDCCRLCAAPVATVSSGAGTSAVRPSRSARAPA